MIETKTKQEPAARPADPFLEQFERLTRIQGTQAPSWLFPKRKAGFSRFVELGFPTTSHEDWRFTNVAPIAKLPFLPILEPTADQAPPALPESLPFTGLPSYRLVFLNGHFLGSLSTARDLPEGVCVTSLGSALRDNHPVLEKHLARYAVGESEPFAALNTALFTDGGFIYLPPGVVLERPIHLLFLSTLPEQGSTAHVRTLIVAEKQSRATILESYAATTQTSYLTNSVIEAVVGERANVELCKFQDESLSGYHVSSLHAELGRAANFISHSIATGSRLARSHIRTHLAGEGVECVLNGLYLTKDDQLIDHHMIVEHAQPHCNSHEYFNGILDDRSKGVFHGRILVRPGAQKTDAKQTNKNLLLSDNSTVNTKPQLEIYADDVKCTHGATIGQLNQESIFYLRARGISADTARRMLIHAFAGEITDRIRYEPAREELDELIWGRLELNPQIGGQQDRK